MGDSENKTVATTVGFDAFVATLPDARRREEAGVLDTLFRRVTGEGPQMWGPSIVGYGSYHYRYDSGREGDAPRAGFSPRKAKLVLYLMGHYGDEQAEADDLMARLGKHSMGKSCLYITKLADVDLAILTQLVALDWRVMNVRYPA